MAVSVGQGARRPQEIDWDRIDKYKFFSVGIVSFSAVTTCLYPLTVLKTNQQAAPSTQTTAQTVSLIWRARGLPGFYRGYTTVIFGMIPSRIVYLGSLEFVKSIASKAGKQLDLHETTLAGSSNFVAAGVASSITQLISVPVDVIAQRQMVHSSRGGSSQGGGLGATTSPTPAGLSASNSLNPSHHAAEARTAGSSSSSSSSSSGGGSNGTVFKRQMHMLSGTVKAYGGPQSAPGQRGIAASSPLSAPSSSAAAANVSGGHGALHVIRTILQEEGVRGLYRGFGASMATFVPSSAVWWGSYGLYQKLAWNAWDQRQSIPGRQHDSTHTAAEASTLDVVIVQVTASIFAGFTSAGLTAPLDLIKTRIQVARKLEGQPTTFRAVAADVLREGGWVGMFRAAGPRMASSALWGTAMVSVYEGLKRVSVKE